MGAVPHRFLQVAHAPSSRQQERGTHCPASSPKDVSEGAKAIGDAQRKRWAAQKAAKK